MTEETKKEAVSLKDRSRIMPLQSAIGNWHIMLPHGTTHDDLLNPEYFKHLARDCGIKQGHLIVAQPEDHSWMARYWVAYTGDQFITLVAEPGYPLKVPGTVFKNKSGYEAKWLGPNGKWGIKRKSDNETIRKGFQSESLANMELEKLFGEMAA